MGALLDKAIDGETDYKIGTIRLPKLSASDADMAGKQTRTHLVVTGDDDTGTGMFSMGGLLAAVRPATWARTSSLRPCRRPRRSKPT